MSRTTLSLLLLSSCSSCSSSLEYEGGFLGGCGLDVGSETTTVIVICWGL